MNETIKDKIASGDASAVVVIITDGEENNSREYDITKVRSMINELQSTGKWTFTFIGANIDSIKTASSYGINTKNVVSFSGDSVSNTKVYKSMSRSFASRASSLDLGTFNSEEFVADEDKDLTTKK